MGGGIYGRFVTATNSTLSGNSTTGDGAQGGGICMDYSQPSPLDLTGTTVSGNSTAGAAASGGGIYGYVVTATNSTVSGNITSGASASGGEIHVNAYGSVALINSTVAENRADGTDADGGGLFLAAADYQPRQAEAAIANSIVAGNAARLGANPDVAGHISSSNGLNIFGSDVDGKLPGDRENVSTSVLFSGGLADHGGPTQTIALLDDPANPALGRADPTQASAADQRGVPRPLPEGTSPDIGAFEMNQSNPVPPPTAKTFIVTGTGDLLARDGVLTLREALALADADNSTADRIKFAPNVQGHTITLNRSQLTVNSDVIIDGGAGVTINARSGEPSVPGARISAPT